MKTNHLVVAFDMCSSTTIIEDLTRTGNLCAYERMIAEIYAWLVRNAATHKYIVYKFTGDGWILLFPTETLCGGNLMTFLTSLAGHHNLMRQMHIDPHLESMPQSVGLTFGVEIGSLRRVVLGETAEFFGRPINVACRLQGAVSQHGSPNYRCLVSRTAYNRVLQNVHSFYFAEATRSLKNIIGGEKFRCLVVDLFAGKNAV